MDHKGQFGRLGQRYVCKNKSGCDAPRLEFGSYVYTHLDGHRKGDAFCIPCALASYEWLPERWEKFVEVKERAGVEMPKHALKGRPKPETPRKRRKRKKVEAAEAGAATEPAPSPFPSATEPA